MGYMFHNGCWYGSLGGAYAAWFNGGVVITEGAAAVAPEGATFVPWTDAPMEVRSVIDEAYLA